ncbi:gamma-glutamyl-gamma-aminobutyrate hydrolase family protein [Pseudoalteromonas piscicida]|uniref:Gamma-glutamyl-gamma-aminobutyrate hydrolase n=1 Tax=Pseudoalteromonas piscicida TaxID=43662 RepID=A0A2A5JVI3_PSEO7|nr:gamma-glutamyl-gamma-aminobutyrate hydrolase family protein [Pseudoalteromonas piscicida]PCK33410.1 gamma-glutamyl-gamma-aminobutyrate hydrolase [Pseudoalteromonas piscicida]
MNLVGLTQRVDISVPHGERRDAIDQKWYSFCQACGVTPVLLPNDINVCKALLSSLDLKGIILTGGNSPVAYGGNAPERDELELFLVEHSITKKIPLVGVCRGMQMLQMINGEKLVKIDGHITSSQIITLKGVPYETNSFHTLGTYVCNPPWSVEACSDDGVIKAIRHEKYPLYGIMWHPERTQPFSSCDLNFFRGLFLS